MAFLKAHLMITLRLFMVLAQIFAYILHYIEDNILTVSSNDLRLSITKHLAAKLIHIIQAQ